MTQEGDTASRSAIWKKRALELAAGAAVAAVVFIIIKPFDGKRNSGVSEAQADFVLRKYATEGLDHMFVASDAMRIVEMSLNADRTCVSGEVTTTRGTQRYFMRGASGVMLESMTLDFDPRWAECRVPEPLRPL